MNKLRTLREKHRIKQIELAVHSGLTAQYISRLENDWEIVSINSFIKLVKGYKHLGIDIMHDLFGQTQEE